MTDQFPWFPMYAADYLSSERVTALTLEQQGAFVRLMCSSWNAGKGEPSITTDAEAQAKVVGLPRKRWDRVKGPVLALFEQRGDRLYNAKMSKLWEIQRAKYELRAKAGREGGKARALNKQNGSNASRLLQHTDAESDRTKSSSAPTLAGASLHRSLASARGGRPA